MNILENKLYREDLDILCGLDLPWEKLERSAVLLSGATGMIGSLLVDVLMRRNKRDGMGCKVHALGRSEAKAKERFPEYIGDGMFQFIAQDINEPLELPDVGQVDYVLHLASNTHPVEYATDPIGTILTNIVGTKHMLDLAVSHGAKRFLFASTVEVYGENRGDVDAFEENYLGYIDCNTLRAGYPESKRCGEALCQAYAAEKGLDIVIPRLARTFGPSMQMDDSKAVAQFILNAAHGEDIVLKSAGTQCYSYTYAADAASGILAVLLNGKSGEAYNIADASFSITLRDLASMLARIAGTKVIFDVPSKTESAGFSKATRAVLDGRKARSIGWEVHWGIWDALEETIEVLSGIG